jgi:peroxiredoxin
MIMTEASNIPIGERAPDFSLPDTQENQPVSLADHAGRPVLVVFMCNHCPYVVHLLDALVGLAHELYAEGIATIAISANDIIRYPQDAPVKMAELAVAKRFGFPYCFDEQQTVARAYGAVCTPDIFLLDAAHHLYYHGQFDDTRPGSGTAHGSDLREAARLLLRGTPAPTDTRPSVGCSIKWKV